MRSFLLLAFVAALAFGQTAQYPGALLTDEYAGKLKDRSASTLTSSISNSTLTVPVADGTRFVGYQLITIDNEQMMVCSVAGNDLTICAGTRGFDWTNPATHSSSTVVRGQITSWLPNSLREDLEAVQGALGVNLGNVALVGHTHDGGGGGGGGANYNQAFSGQTSVTLAHNLGTKNIVVQCYNSSDQFIEWLTLTATSTTQAVVTFTSAQTGRCVVNGTGAARYAVGFTGQTTVTITGASHGLGIADLAVTVYDTSSPRKRVEPNTVTIDASTFAVVVTFAQAQSGRVVLN